jgi:predicted PurR-regulated permease PerM
MVTSRLVEKVFFFAILLGVGYLVWLLVSPLAGAIALAAIVATVCYPLYERIQKTLPAGRDSLASLLCIVSVLALLIVPILTLGTLIFREAAEIYTLVNTGESSNSFTASLERVETQIQLYIPGFTVDIAGVIEAGAGFVAGQIVSLFASTATTVFLFFLALIALFYFFRDGTRFVDFLIDLSPLKDSKDNRIIERLGASVRSVALGTLFIALIQGSLTGLGLWIFGFERAVLWGMVAGVGALVPGLGTAIVFVPAVIYSIVTGDTTAAIGITIWGVVAVGLIDNILGPYLLSRGNHIHPFLILVSVLGGLAYFGPIGFILGPVVMSLFLVLLELYAESVRAPSHHAESQ